MDLSANIRRLRKEKGLTQEQVAQALGVTAGAVNKWERGASCPDLALRVNGSTDYRYCDAAGSGSGGDYCTELVELWAEDQHPWADIHFSWPRPGAPVRAVYFTVRDTTYQGFQCYCRDCTWEEVTTFNLLAPGGTVPAGTRVLMYGVRK